MKKVNIKTLYAVGERIPLPCGCMAIAEETGFTHYIHPDCPYDNKPHIQMPSYRYKPWNELPQEEIIDHNCPEH